MKLLEYLKENRLYMDGGLGTLLQAAGLQPGEYPERWSLTRPEVLRKIHREYYDAGSNVVSANTFGANSLKFAPEELEALIRAAVENAAAARAESAAPQEKFIALDVGPLGRLLKPFGDFDFEEAVSVFSRTMRLGEKYGADLILIETMNDSYETKAALLAAKESCSLPVFVSNAYGEDGKLMTGADPAAMVAMLEGMHADAIGVNCSLGPEALAPIVEEYLRYSSLPLLLMPNAGMPRVEQGKTVYDVGPEAFAGHVAALMGKGVRIAGGCCGTTPEYIRALLRHAAQLPPAAPVEQKDFTCVSSYTHAVFLGERPILIGERINPTGKKRFKQALLEGDIDYILNEGIRQQEQGVHVLDVNVGLPEIQEADMLERAVYELQAVLDLPLQIDTADPEAMERALRRYNGKAMVNSVSGKAESMAAVFPLVQKYGGLVVALTLDENGIPETADGRVKIAERILETAAQYGIGKKDIIFDTLAMTISAAPGAGLVTLAALREIRQHLGCHTSLGVSNISFGLPDRAGLNSSFFTLAMENGLSAAIMNPHAPDMLRAYYAFCALHALDENCGDYIRFAQSYSPAPAAVAAAAPHGEKTAAEDYASALQKAVIKGLKEQAGAACAALLETVPPLEIVERELIPALDTVGRGFEEKRLYLPQLLMSAEAAKYAFEQVKARLEQSSAGAGKFPVVVATVQGDIHDIGKNIVKLLLENYGFPVTDLGKDVPPETVAETVHRLHAPLVGLSALMTTTVPAMEATIRLLKEQAPWCRIVVGGAVLTEDYAQKIGADHYARDAMETVRYAGSLETE